jgi:phage pi2 protein 07
LETIKRKFRKKNISCAVYTPEEAKQVQELGIIPVHWQQARKKGQWIYDDAGYVSQVLDVMGPYGPAGKPKTRHVIYMAYCRAFIPSKMLIDYQNYKGKGDYYSTMPDDWVGREMKNKRTKQAIALYASVMLEKGRATEKDLDIIGKIYRPDQEQPKLTFKRLLKNQKIKNMIAEELKKLLSDYGVTEGDVINNYKNIMEQAYTNRQFGVAKNVNDMFAKMLNMDGSPVPNKPSLNGATEDDDLAALLPSDDDVESLDDAEYIIEQPTEEFEYEPKTDYQ